MRKCIKLNDNLICKEILTQVDRVNDVLTCQLIIEPIYNTPYTKVINNYYELIIAKIDRPAAWAELKDGDINIIDWLLSELAKITEDNIAEYFFISRFFALKNEYPDMVAVNMGDL